MDWRPPAGWTTTLDETGKGWAYDVDESPDSGTVTLSQVQNAVYHRYLRRTGLPLEELLDINPRYDDVDNRTSHIHEFTLSGEQRLSGERISRSKYNRDSHAYIVWELEEMRTQHLQRVAKGSDSGINLTVVENISPPVMEILGSSLGLPATFFKSHIAASWDGGSELLGWSIMQETALWRAPYRKLGSSMVFRIPFPRLYEVHHPSAWKVPEWRAECLRRAARHLQSNQLLPILDHPSLNMVQCIAFEHNSFHSHSRQDGVAQTTLLFSPTVRNWSDGNLVVKRDRRITMRLPPPLLQGDLEDLNLHDSDATSWIDALTNELYVLATLDADLSSMHSDQIGLFAIFKTLLEEALNHWNTFLVHITRAIELLSESSRAASADMALLPQQQVKALVVQGSSYISDISHTIQAMTRSVGCTATTLGTEFEEIHQHFQSIRNQLQNHLPTLQHHIDIIVQRQQVRLQETQLEESRKAIQQADTIKRLTMLAFVYIPIQTASSVFGMNVSELRPDISVWIFAVTAAVLLLLTLTAAAWKHIWPTSIYVLNNSGEATRRLCRAVIRPFAGCFDGNILEAQILRSRRAEEDHRMEPSWVM